MCFFVEEKMLKENLKHYRELKGYSKIELARLSGISRRTIMLIEEGRTLSPGYKTLVKLANILEIAVQDLVK